MQGSASTAPCQEQGHLPLHQVAPSPVQTDHECLPGWGSSSGQPFCQCLPTFIFPHFQPNVTIIPFEAIPVSWHFRPLSSVPLQLSWSAFRHWKRLEGVPEPSPDCTIPALPAWLQRASSPQSITVASWICPNTSTLRCWSCRWGLRAEEKEKKSPRGPAGGGLAPWPGGGCPCVPRQCAGVNAL